MFNFSPDFASTTLSVFGTVIVPFEPLLVVVIGVALAIIAVVLLLRVLTHH